VGFTSGEVKQARAHAWANFSNYASSGWSFRALLLDIDHWLAKGTKPPDSAYLHLANGLAARELVLLGERFYSRSSV
jgi:hypothetical protein